MNLPLKISIVTPNYNLGNFIERTILSVLNQSYSNFEYIIIDGGSTDQSIDIIKKYSDKLHYWVSEKDNGMYDAIQKGFERSTGDIMMWINSDDLLHPGAFENIVEVFTSFPEVEWITGLNTAFDEKDRVTGACEARKISNYNILSKDYKWIQQETTVWKRSLWEKSGSYINNKAKLAGDLELWLRFSMKAKLYPCNLLIGGFRQRSSNQLTLEMDKYCKEANFFIDNMNISFKIKINLMFITFINNIKQIMKYTLVLDIFFIRRMLDKSILLIKNYPERIVVNRLDGKLKLEK
ncbi:glycosyltransferase family 2 protein [Spirosoma validum]|uniref:Glycosyltransferase n=1 Tax=Spirosoma validum TaxID=2771355 RepID=A0A927B0S6_9BACT|nr:glycosyltransferase family 2 protein [Spirosoma validum]MBD2753315.1 glycosyltransferase [Spirosoma validum]